MADVDEYYLLYDEKPPFSGMAVASLVLSLTGICCFVGAPVGAALGHVARLRIGRGHLRGDGVATAGIIIGWIVTALYACCCGLLAYAFPDAATAVLHWFT